MFSSDSVKCRIMNACSLGTFHRPYTARFTAPNPIPVKYTISLSSFPSEPLFLISCEIYWKFGSFFIGSFISSSMPTAFVVHTQEVFREKNEVDHSFGDSVDCGESRMARWLGHSMTGTFFWVLGFFFLLRAIWIGKLKLLRTSLLGTLFESLAMMTGGILYTFGEVVLMQIELGKWQMSTSQHVIMSLSLTLLGSFYLLYQVQMLPGAIWAFSPAFLWFVLGILWLLHPQD